ncbi:MAG TPA: Gfo/Idh/MocA family oxidoreductase [Limnochordia bacterium]|nr:Gfo/Idh/MocA family oxidoreductase [Limnochordia bacterium]
MSETSGDPVHNQSVRPVRIGLIGCGGIVRGTHAPAYETLGDVVQVAALADPVDENRHTMGERFAVPPAHRFADYRDLLAAGVVDAVVVATPHHLHAQQVVDAATAGVAIVSEKPMATTLEEADTILAAVRKHGVHYAVVHNLLFSAAMKTALAIRHSGELGEIVFGRSQSLALKAPDFNTGRRDPGQIWRAQRSAGGGCAIDSSYHEIYAVEALVGSPVRYVEGRIQTRRFDIDVDDVAIMLFEHENGVTSTVSSAWCVPARNGGRWCEVHGSEGSVHVVHRDNDPIVRFHHGGRGWQPEALHEPAVELSSGKLDSTGHRGYFEATFRALAKGEAPPITGENARHNLAIIEGARKASQERRAVDLSA